ncbi:lipid-A-disaccharide synthase [Desulfobacterales bacterium HSG17]|nr:lipid-A-disaccharide synthase [Desulfobacterales bacterium HSG17]
MKTDNPQKCVMVIAGETSGDIHAAHLVHAMRAKDPNLFFCGFGGEAMHNAGVRILVDANDLAVVGITEVIGRLPVIFRSMSRAKALLKSLAPELLIIVDFPDFNLRVAKFAKKIGITVLYYISPQVWAWRENRVHTIKKRIDHLAVILPFEADFFKKYDLPVTFVGHPLLDELPQSGPDNDYLPVPTSPVIGFLPGSRPKEILRLLPAMLGAAAQIAVRLPSAKFQISAAPGIDKEWLEYLIGLYQPKIEIVVVKEDVHRFMANSHVLVAASGTVTLQAALSGKPLVIIYKVSGFSYFLGKHLIRVKFIGLVNLIADEELAPELIQKDATPEKIAQKVIEIISDKETYQSLCRKLAALKERLGGRGASERCAEIAIDLMQKMPQPLLLPFGHREDSETIQKEIPPRVKC